MQVYQQQIVHHIAHSFVVVVWVCIVVSCTHVAVVDRDAQVYHLRQVIQLRHVVNNTLLVQQHHFDVFHHNIAWDLILDLY
jgi:hypothetical protein